MFLVATIDLRSRSAGFFALLIRLELLTPGPTIMDAMTYNRMFTLHGVVMIFLFMIPAIPSGFGNFLLPIMIGAKDVAFPRLNLLSLLPLPRRRGRSRSAGMVHGGADTGWTFYTPYSTTTIDEGRAGPARRVHPRLLVDPHRPQLHRHDPHDARAGPQLDAAAAVRVVDLRDVDHPGARDAGARHDAPARRGRARVRLGHLRSGARRRPGALPAPLLVLLAPRRLHHGAAGDGGDLRGGLRLRAQEHLRLQGRRLLARSASRSSASSPGATTCSRRASPPFDARRLRRALDVRGHLHGHQGLQLDGDPLQGLDRVHDAVRLLLSGSCSSSCSAG